LHSKEKYNYDIQNYWARIAWFIGQLLL
jgi:hypothetical protein